MKHSIKFYPVGNGDCDLITIGGTNKKMMFDCNFRQKAEEDSDEMYDVLDDLLSNELTSKKYGLPFLDAFLLTHPDQDHCRSFAAKFYLGDPDSVSQSAKDDKKILIGELWYSPRVFEELTGDLNSDAKAFKEEAKRRMDLYKSDKNKADKDGNRIRIIGWTDDPNLKGLEDRIVTPGDTISKVNGSNCRYFEMFIHAPFKDDIDGEDRNMTSIVVQLRFDSEKERQIARIFLAGDTEWRVMEEIMNKTYDDNNLKWDLLEAPHHCSYKFFADDREGEPNQASLNFLDKKESNAYVVSSSKVVKHNSDNPPCQKAKNRYTDKVGKSNFLCTSGTYEDEADKPIVFEIDNDGLKLMEDKVKAKAAVPPIRNTKPHYYGSLL